MTPLTAPRDQVNETNPLAHLMLHLEFATREAVLQEIVRVWSENQEMVRFESFTRRLLSLRSARTDVEFQQRAADLILWFNHEQPYMPDEPHTVSGDLLESYLLRSPGSFIHALSEPATTWRVDIQPSLKRIQISDPRLNWKGQTYPWQRVKKLADAASLDKRFEGWRTSLYIRDSDGEACRVQWINVDTGEMSCESARSGSYAIRMLFDWRERWLS